MPYKFQRKKIENKKASKKWNLKKKKKKKEKRASKNIYIEAQKKKKRLPELRMA